MKTIVVTAATEAEISLLADLLGARRLPVKGVPHVSELETGDRRIVLAATGLGKSNAAAATAALTVRFSPELLVNTGCAGAYRGSGLSIGDLAVAGAEVYGDEGVLTPSGWRPLDLIGIPLAETGGGRYFNEIPLAPRIVDKAVQYAGINCIPLRSGRFVTVSTCSGTASRGDELSSRFDAVCENMEGAAVAHVALLYGVDCVEVRGVSNMVEDRDLSRWDLTLAVENAQRFLHGFIHWFKFY